MNSRLLGHTAGILAGLMLWLTASAASASVLPYTANSAMGNDPIYSLAKLNDGITAATGVNGYVPYKSKGDILITFPMPANITEMRLFNNVNGGTGGLISFKVQVFDTTGHVTQATYTNVPNTAAPFVQSVNWTGVTKILVSVQGDGMSPVEIRELEFEGANVGFPSFTLSCAEVNATGMQLKTMTKVRTSAPKPVAGSISFPASFPSGPLRGYSDAAPQRLFLDSFDLPLRNVCQADVTVTGRSGSVRNDDFLTIILPLGQGLILSGGQVPSATAVEIGTRTHLADNSGVWTVTRSLTKANAALRAGLLQWGNNSQLNALDIVVQDDSVVNSITVTYTYID